MASKSNDLIFYLSCMSGLLLSSFIISTSLEELKNSKANFFNIHRFEPSSPQLDELLKKLRPNQFHIICKLFMGGSLFAFFGLMVAIH